jgi:hypothetical protein
MTPAFRFIEFLDAEGKVVFAPEAQRAARP